MARVLSVRLLSFLFVGMSSMFFMPVPRSPSITTLSARSSASDIEWVTNITVSGLWVGWRFSTAVGGGLAIGGFVVGWSGVVGCALSVRSIISIIELKICWAIFVSSALKGSSHKCSVDGYAKALAIETLCAIPPDSCFG